MLDTNICIYLIRSRSTRILEQFKQHAIEDLGVSSITVAELHYGAFKSQQTERNKLALQQFLLPLSVADFDPHAATVYGQIRAELEAQGRPIGALDMLIAAHALSLDITLVTNNEREFVQVPDLDVENWAR